MPGLSGLGMEAVPGTSVSGANPGLFPETSVPGTLAPGFKLSGTSPVLETRWQKTAGPVSGPKKKRGSSESVSWDPLVAGSHDTHWQSTATVFSVVPQQQRGFLCPKNAEGFVCCAKNGRESAGAHKPVGGVIRPGVSLAPWWGESPNRASVSLPSGHPLGEVGCLQRQTSCH